jgi:hypothetical protein
MNEDNEMSLLECRIYIEQLQRIYGAPPEQASFFVLLNFYENSVYYEAAIQFNRVDKNALQYALTVETGALFWDQVSKQQLKSADHPNYFMNAMPINHLHKNNAS